MYEDDAYIVQALDALGSVDVICIQEYLAGADDNVKKWFEYNGYTVRFQAFSEEEGYRLGVFTAVRSKLEVEFTYHELRNDYPTRLRPFSNSRGVLVANVKLGDTVASIFNTHMTYARFHTHEMRVREFNNLKAMLVADYTSSKVILLGDFNFVGADSRRRHLKKEYQFFTGTFFDKTWSHKPQLSPLNANLDYVFWKEADFDIESKLLPKSGSDHRPLLCKITEATDK